MVSSLGGVVQGAAAHRAGLVRSREFPYFQVNDPEEGALGVSVHSAFPGSPGFAQIGFWIRATVAASDDLLRYGELPDGSDAAFWRGTGLVAAIPLFEPDRFGWATEGIEQILAAQYVARLPELLKLPIQEEHLALFPLGHVGVAGAVEWAREKLASGAVSRVVVVGVDSYLDPLDLAWLGTANRLKSPTRPDGLMPGEAGACLLVEPDGEPQPRAGQVAGRMERTAILLAPPAREGGEGEEDEHRLPEPAEVGPRLAEGVRSVLGGEPFAGDVYTDLNGERWKANAWGFAQTRLHQQLDFDRCRFVAPCESFGETGAASAALAVCLAMRSFEREYALARRALICSISDRGDVAAAVVGRSSA